MKQRLSGPLVGEGPGGAGGFLPLPPGEGRGEGSSSVEVESYVPLGKTEAPAQRNGEDAPQERYFMTVIVARVEGSDWEAPVSKAPVEWRPRNNRVRESDALALRDKIRSLRSSGWALERKDAQGDKALTT